jgi:Asp-tRNA(Asn)/Glu-tRNA(Gln) amidotransferase A subunit family amidase
MSPSELVCLSAEEALGRFRDRSFSPVELTRAVLDRAEATEPAINALPLRDPEAALAAARRAEARYMGQGEAPRPLEGLCLAIKDSSDLAGQPTSAGSLTTPETPAATSGIANARALAAGAIPHARSATPEFSCASVTWSRKWGVTRNPRDLSRTSSGSCGGGVDPINIGGVAVDPLLG